MTRRKTFKEKYGWRAKKIKFYRVYARKKGSSSGIGIYMGSIKASTLKEAEKKGKLMFTKYYYDNIHVKLEEYPMPDRRAFKVIG